MSTVITVENLGKKYTLSHQQREPYTALRDVIANGFSNFSKKIFSSFTHHYSSIQTSEDFWALKDVSFEVKQGDRIGIIGRNGAGKSTLLKILSRITEPTTGRVRIKGRVASLLEVGTGFHPELTGRENIFLNGAILGMGRAEIKKKFDEIVDFAEIEKFLDTPVKRYSSGMYVRLAFAVAAHLEPEILVVDEVLAVGDAQFQKKCLGKMEDVSNKEGRTVLFVSHNMNAIEQLCTSIVLLDSGRVIRHETTMRSVLKDYLFGLNGKCGISEWSNSGNDFNNQWFKPISMYIVDELGKRQYSPVSNDADMFFCVEGEINEAEPALQVGYALYSEEGNLLYWTCYTDVEERLWPELNTGQCLLKSRIPKNILNEGTYKIELIVALYYKQWLCEPGNNSPSINLTIQGGLSNSPYWMIKRPGLLAPILDWQTP